MRERSGRKVVYTTFVVLLLLSAFFMVAVSNSVSAVQEGDYTYIVSGSPAAATITGYTGTGGAITIPSTLGGYPVKTIGDSSFSHCTSLTSVVLPSGIVAISYAAFWHCTSLTSVSIPGTVTSIGICTFSECYSLASLTIPNGVKTLGSQAFSYCNSLTSVIIPSSVTSIENQTFFSCTSMTEINVDTGNLNYASVDGVLYNKAITVLIECPCAKTGALIIPNGVTSIESLAFVYCTLLTSVTMPSSLTHIGYDSFDSCSSLTSLTIPDSVSSIDINAFASCISLTSVILPSGITSISMGTFYNCTSLTAVTLPEGLTAIGDWAFGDCISLVSMTIPNNVTSIGGQEFVRCFSLSSIIIGKKVNSIGDAAFDTCTSLTSISFLGHVAPMVGANWIYATPAALRGHAYASSDFPAPGNVFNGLMMGDVIRGDSGVPEDYIYLISDGKVTVTGYTGPGGTIVIPPTFEGYPTTAIGSMAFALREDLTSVIIPIGVTAIGEGAFQSCTALTSINVPNGVTSIGDSAFYSCLQLTSINIPSGVANIGNYTFSSCQSLTSVTIANGVAHIWEGAFDRCSALTSLTIPTSVTSIENNAFAYCSSLISITIPSSVTSIGYYVFIECESLTAINVNPGNPNYSGIEGVLYDKTATTLLRCPEGKVGAVIIPDSVTNIWEVAFAGCHSLTSVVIPDSVTNISRWAFGYCSSLISITIPNSVTTIGYSTFYGCDSLINVTIGNSVINIDDTSFSYCSALTHIDIPGNVQTIGNFTFDQCTSLASIRFLGLVAPTVGDFWIYGTSAALRGHAYAASNFPAPGDYFHGLMMGDAIPASGSPGIPQGLHATGSNAKTVLTWTAPVDNGGSIITNYTVYRSIMDSGPYTALASTPATSYTDSNLTNGQTYWYRVSAVNAIGESALTGPVSSTPFTVPDAPTGLFALPGNAEVTLNWNEPSFDGGAAVDYFVVYRDGVALPDSPNWTYAMITDLNNGQTYSFTVAAHNTAGIGAQSEPASETPFTIPSAPTGLAATAGNMTITLNWTTPAFDGGRAIDYYILYENGAVLLDHLTIETIDIFDLINGESYDFAVAAHNIAGNGTQSTMVSATPFTIPDPPILTDVFDGIESVVLHWTEPAFDGGSPIIGYKVFYGPNDPLTQFGGIFPSTTTSVRVTGLVTGAQYNLFVVAVNLAGDSSPSNDTWVLIPRGPGIIISCEVTPLSDQVTLMWNPPMDTGNGIVEYYSIYRGASADDYALLGNSSSNTYIDKTVTPGSTYHYRLSAVNWVGEGNKSADIMVLVPLPTLNGRIIDADGNGMAGITVALENGSSVETDTWGIFIIAASPGNHTLTISGSGIRTQNESVIVGNSDIALGSITAQELNIGIGIEVILAVAIIALAGIGAGLFLWKKKKKA